MWKWVVCEEGVCVCVDHPHRCKTSFCLFCVLINNFLAMYAGGHSISLGLCPTKLPVKRDIRLGQLDVPAPISFFVNGNRLSQVPACRSKPFHFLHCCRNLTFYFILGSVASEPSSEQGRRKHTSNWFSRWINHFLLSDFNGLFVHVRCIPHQ